MQLFYVIDYLRFDDSILKLYDPFSRIFTFFPYFAIPGKQA